ncbi:MAG: hypothetical protein Q9Q40_09505 [Acidobacteriota bacterium]|nr:hypothetical protein [Acidobacteriota bacterium]
MVRRHACGAGRRRWTPGRTGKVLLLCLAGLLASLPSAPALETPAVPTLLEPDHPVRRPTDPIRIRVPGLATLEPDRIMLEIDDFDVTDIAHVDTGSEILSIRPVEALEWGEHRLRLTVRGPDGEFLERGAWSFEIRHSRHLREVGMTAEASASGFRRVLARDPEDTGKRSGADGGARFSGAVSDDGWRLSAAGELLYDSDPLQLPRERGSVDLGDFLLRGEFGSWWLAAGHQDPAAPSLVLQELRRRGVSTGYGDLEGNLYAAAFLVRSQQVTGLTGGFGVGDTGDRVEGLTVRGRPLDGRPEALVLSATWLSGRDPGQTGEGVGGDTITRARGRAASVSLASRLLDDRLQIDAELARTRFDFDGDGSAEARRDRALSARMGWAALRDHQIRNRTATLDLGLEHRRIGTFFRSIADPTVVADRDLLRATGAFSWAGWDAQAELSREFDNVNGLPLLPRLRTTQGTLSIGWMAPPPDDEDPAPWYGQPSLTVNWIRLGQNVVRPGIELPVGDFRETDTLSLSAAFSYPAWHWSAGHTVGSETDYAETSANTENRITELGVQITPGSGASVGISMQRSLTRDRDAGAAWTTDTVVIDLGHTLKAGLHASLGASWNRDRSSNGAASPRTLDLTGMLQWVVQEGGGGRPAILLSLEGQHHRRRDPADLSGSARVYRVYLRLAVSWSTDR